VQEYAAEELDTSGDGKMGDAVAEVSINAPAPGAPGSAGGNNTITIKVTGIFAGDSETVTSTVKLMENANFTYQNTSFKRPSGSAFDPGKYAADAVALNELSTSAGDPVLVGDMGKYDFYTAIAGDTYPGDRMNPLYMPDYLNNQDQGSVNEEITDKNNTTTEVMWRSGPTEGADAYTDPLTVIQGTKRTLDSNATVPPSPEGYISTRRLVSAANGRFLVNPIQPGAYYHRGSDNRGGLPEDGSGFDSANTPDNGTNTRFNSLSIDTSEAMTSGDGNIKVRVANDGFTYADTNTNDYLTAYNAMIGLDFVNLKKYTDADNNIKNIEATVKSYFQFGNLTGTELGDFKYHPIDWNSCDIFVPDDSDLEETNLIFGMYGHKYINGLDAISKGNYVNEWIGQTPGEWDAIYREARNDRFAQYGLNNVPVTWDKTRLMCLDGATDRYLRILQGVSIIDGAVYSNRRTIIGGGLIPAGVNDQSRTADNVNSYITGYMGNEFDSNKNADGGANYVVSSVMYDQVFKDTDIIFADSSQPVYSEIRRPNTWQDRASGDLKVTDKAKAFNPKLLITGGEMYVGKNQILRIGTFGKEYVTDDPDLMPLPLGVPLDNMMVAPSNITVANGGKLFIGKSDFVNVNTNIYVSNGAWLEIRRGAKVEGNIIVESGGNAVLNIGFSASDSEKAQFTGDIFVKKSGTLTVGNYGEITGDIYVDGDDSDATASNGTLTINANCVITGDVHMMGILIKSGNAKLTVNFDPASDPNRGDNPVTVNIDESVTETKGGKGVYPYHGIFMYSTQGARGVLQLKTAAVNGFQVDGNSGKIHLFGGDASAPDTANWTPAQKENIYCYHEEPRPDTCQHWTTESYIWSKQEDSTGGNT
jgi:hypothetical protein